MSKLKEQNYILNTVLKSAKSLQDYNDGLLHLKKILQNKLTSLNPKKIEEMACLNKLMGDYVNVKEKFLQKDFIPDANSTLRLTYGHVRGYSPVDANFMAPYTTIRGILEKGATGNPDFAYPPQIKALWDAKDFGLLPKKS